MIPRAGERPEPLPPALAILTGIGILLLFTVPPPLLDLLGIGYSSPTGAPWAKIHPGTDILMLAAGLTACRMGNPLRWPLVQFRRFPAVAIYLATILLLIVYIIKIQRAPFTPIIDTFIMPAVLFFLLVDMPKTSDAFLEWGLHAFLAFNAALGIVEMLTGWRLIPTVVDGFEFTADIEWRASGMLGHPLASAAAAGQYAVILGLGCGRRLTGALRVGAVALQLISLGAFGGRTALVVTLLVFAILGVAQLVATLAGRRMSRRALGFVMLGIPLLAVAVAALVSSGFFDQLVGRFEDDNGSAKSRGIIFNLFGYLSWQELIFGPDQDHIGSLLHLEGIEVGVESFWIGYIMFTGLAMSTLVFLAFGLFLWQVLQRTDIKAVIPLIFFLLIISTSVSLSAKSASLGQLVVMLMVLMPARPKRVPVENAMRLALT